MYPSENMKMTVVKQLIGEEKAQKVEQLAIALYTKVILRLVWVDGRLQIMRKQEELSSQIQNSNSEKMKPEKSF
jgi:hypothetical protein